VPARAGLARLGMGDQAVGQQKLRDYGDEKNREEDLTPAELRELKEDTAEAIRTAYALKVQGPAADAGAEGGGGYSSNSAGFVESFMRRPHSSHEVLEVVREAYLDEAAADTVNVLEQLALRDKLVACLRAEVVALDQVLRQEMERRKELERGLRNWRLAREAVDASRAEQLREEMEQKKKMNCALTNFKLARTVLETLDVSTGESI
jgi:hypothetical protein